MTESPRIARPFIVYAGGVLLAGMALYAYSWAHFPPQFSWQFVLLAAAVLLSENYAFSIEPYSISLAFPLAMAAAVLGGPVVGSTIAVLGCTNLRELREGKPLSRVLFNVGQLALSTGLAALTYQALGGRFLQAADGSFSGWGLVDFPGTLLPMAVAALVCVVANMLLTATGMSLLTGLPLGNTVATMVTLMPTQLALAFVGYLIAGTLAISALALPLFVAPLVVAQQLYRRYADMKTAFVDTIRSLVGALEAKDPYTRGHSERVAEYAATLGLALGLSHREIERLEYAALLHDLGKLAVPSAILVKPGRLLPEEMDLILEHPARGSRMIAGIPPLRDLAEAVAQHHEWHDGSGYPDGLVGEQTLLAARILSVVDCFDAMTTTRAYRPALSHDQAIAELIRAAGTQFDPEIVRIFIDARVGRAVETVPETEADSSVASVEAAGLRG